MFKSFYHSTLAFLRSLNQRAAIALMATVVSLCALCVSLYQVRLAKNQQMAAVWPYVSIGGHSTANGPKQAWGITVTNNGLGPAIIEQVRLRYAGKDFAFQTLVDSLAAWTSRLDSLKSMNYAVGAIDRGTVIPAGNAVEWLAFDLSFSVPASAPPKAQEYFRNLSIVVRYKSLYGEIWESSFNEKDTEDGVRKIE